jgi:RNA polymerase sigma-70 factor (ECF subfamily)
MLLASRQIQRRVQPRVSPSDVVQETMLRAHENFGQFRGKSEQELLAWLRKILVSSLARFVEQHMLAAKRDVRKEVSAMPIDQFAEPSGASGIRAERSALVRGLLEQLPEHYREVLVLRNIQGLSFEEVAARLGRSPGAARMLWLRAIEKLRAVYRSTELHDP